METCLFKPTRGEQCTSKEILPYGYCTKHSKTIKGKEAKRAWEVLNPVVEPTLQSTVAEPNIQSTVVEQVLHNSVVEQALDTKADTLDTTVTAKIPVEKPVNETKPNVSYIDRTNVRSSIKVVKNRYGRYEHLETKLLFNKSTNSVYGVQLSNGNIGPLSSKEKRICNDNGWTITESIYESPSDADVLSDSDNNIDYRYSSASNRGISSGSRGGISTTTRDPYTRNTIPSVTTPRSNNNPTGNTFKQRPVNTFGMMSSDRARPNINNFFTRSVDSRTNSINDKVDTSIQETRPPHRPNTINRTFGDASTRPNIRSRLDAEPRSLQDRHTRPRPDIRSRLDAEPRSPRDMTKRTINDNKNDERLHLSKMTRKLLDSTDSDSDSLESKDTDSDKPTRSVSDRFKKFEPKKQNSKRLYAFDDSDSESESFKKPDPKKLVDTRYRINNRSLHNTNRPIDKSVKDFKTKDSKSKESDSKSKESESESESNDSKRAIPGRLNMQKVDGMKRVPMYRR